METITALFGTYEVVLKEPVQQLGVRSDFIAFCDETFARHILGRAFSLDKIH